jgi:hypothetical protein
MSSKRKETGIKTEKREWVPKGTITPNVATDIPQSQPKVLLLNPSKNLTNQKQKVEIKKAESKEYIICDCGKRVCNFPPSLGSHRNGPTHKHWMSQQTQQTAHPVSYGKSISLSLCDKDEATL